MRALKFSRSKESPGIQRHRFFGVSLESAREPLTSREVHCNLKRYSDMVQLNMTEYWNHHLPFSNNFVIFFFLILMFLFLLLFEKRKKCFLRSVFFHHHHHHLNAKQTWFVVSYVKFNRLSWCVSCLALTCTLTVKTVR